MDCACFSRSGDVIEYLMKDQWFVSCREMADKAVEVRAFLCTMCHIVAFVVVNNAHFAFEIRLLRNFPMIVQELNTHA